MRNLLILELAPQRARRVQKINVVDGQPLLSARNARSVTRNRFCFFDHSVYDGGFSAVGNAHNHSSDRYIRALLGIFFNFVGNDFFESCHDLRAIARSSDCLYVRFSLSFKLFAPQIEVAFFNEIALVENVKHPLALQKFVEKRIIARVNRSCINDVNKRVDKTEIVLHHAYRLCHVSGKPLNIHIASLTIFGNLTNNFEKISVSICL